MRKIESLIAHFVDALLQSLREAALAELDAAPARPQKRTPPARPPRSSSAPKAHARAAPAKPGRPRVPRAPKRALTPKQDAAPSVAEITDPEWLLRAVAAPPAAVPDLLAGLTDDAEPTSVERPVRTTTSVPLRADEAIVRSSGAGVVIRRAARA